MNRVAIFGGLGNQMFQYALAIVMDSNGIPTKISVNDYLLNRHHYGFELLKAFNVPIPIRDRMKVYVVNKSRQVFVDINWVYVRRLISKLFMTTKCIFNETMEYSFDERVFEQENSLLIGTWQCFKYFETQEDLIREVFNFKKPIDPLNLKLSKEIKSVNAIAVHVRRGDFLNPGMSNRRIIIDLKDYYQNAFDIMNNTVENPVFYVFSDEISGAKQNLKGENVKFISHNSGSNSYLDMYLMSLCKHFVIANSTFSWWAAWLAENKKKKVIIPSPWIKGSKCKGLYPKDWIVLETQPKPLELIK